MGERPNADSFHAGFGDFTKRRQCHSPGSFQQHRRSRRLTQAYSLAQDWDRHVVQQNNVRLSLERIAKLVESVDLDFDRYPSRRLRACCADSVSDAARHRPSGKVVVFDQNPIVESHAVIRSAAASNGVLFHKSITGMCLTSIQNLGASSGHFIHIGPRQRRDPREMRQKIEHRSLTDEKFVERAGNGGDDVSRRQTVAIGFMCNPLNAGIESLEDEPTDRRPREHSGLSRNDIHYGCAGRVDQRPTREVPQLAQILCERQIDQMRRGALFPVVEGGLCSGH